MKLFAEFKVKMQEMLQFDGFTFPDGRDVYDGMSTKFGKINLVDNIVETENISSAPGKQWVQSYMPFILTNNSKAIDRLFAMDLLCDCHIKNR